MSRLSRLTPAERLLAADTQRQRAAEAARVYADSCAQVDARENGRCLRCGEPGTEHHHRDPKGMGGVTDNHGVHAVPNLVLACGACHRWAHRHPAQPALDGWLLHGRDPERTPILASTGWFDGWFLLTPGATHLWVARQPPHLPMSADEAAALAASLFTEEHR